MKSKIRITFGVLLTVIGMAIIFFGIYGLIDTWNHGWLWIAGQGVLFGRIGYVMIVNGDIWKNVRYAITITVLSGLLVSRGGN